MKTTLTLLLLFTGLMVFSQVATVVEGKEFARSKAESFNGFLGESGLEIFTVDYIYSNKKKKELIARKFFKSDLSLTLEKDIFQNPLQENYYSDPFEILLINDKLYLFSVFTHTKEQTTTFGLAIYNEQLERESFEIIDSIANLSLTNMIVQVSKNNQAILISQNHPHKISSKEAVNLHCIDLSGQTIWKKELVSLNTVSRLNIEKVVFPNVDEVFLLCNYGFNSNRTASVDDVKLLTNKYVLWAFNKKINFLKEVDLRLKLKWLNGVDIAMKKNGKLQVSGFVNSSRDFAIDALFNIELNEKYDVISNNYYKMTSENLTLFKTKKNNKSQLNNYFLRHLIPLDDGSFYLIGEQYYTYLDRIYDPRTNTTSTTEHFNYEYILVAYFDNRGNIQWLKRVPKIQNSTNDNGYYSSFTVFKKNNDLYLIYNENNHNIKLEIDEIDNMKPLFNGRRNAWAFAKINPNGEVTRRAISIENNNYLLNAKKSFQMSNDKMYLQGELNRKAKIIGLSF
ncbi:MAG: hypothetical protein AB8B74_03790 [Crocinitomicaceae bacterium]